MEGEKEVGHFLEDLRSKGCRVYHDIIGDGFNIDHVVIAPQGIFTIETKTRMKPKGDFHVVFDGEKILVDGYEPDRNPIQQAQAQRRWLYNLLLETTGKKFPVKAAVVFPGWYVKKTNDAKKSDVWVLNHKGIPAFINKEPVVLNLEDIELAASRLVIHMQAH